jgi:hypothetical protein
VVTDRIEHMFDATEARDLDTAQVLEAVAAERRAADRSEAAILALAVHYVDLHPVLGNEPRAEWAPPRLAVHDRETGRFEPSAGPLAGVGTPAVAEYAVEELAAALGVGYLSGLQLVSDAVELCFRLPRLWALVHDGSLQAWKARTVATETKQLSQKAAAFVDRHLAAIAGRNKLPLPGAIRALVHEAMLRCDPEAAAAIERAALKKRGVWFDHRSSAATTQLTATMDTTDARELESTVNDLATTLGHLGDTDDVDIRRAHALGMLADPQRTLDLLTGSTESTSTDGSAADDGVATWAPSRVGVTLYVHVSAAELATGSGGAWVERLGPISLDLLTEWIGRCGGSMVPATAGAVPGGGQPGGLTGVTVRPVLDMNRTDATDGHDPTAATRELVILRDGHCVFPGCLIDARSCDLDHMEAYDEDGPPGQTSPENLACLCRRHHRLKTFAGWTYHRTSAGRYAWTSRHGLSYLV